MLLLQVILWEMWAGRRSWAGLSPTQIAHGVTSGRKLPSLDAAPAWLEVRGWLGKNSAHVGVLQQICYFGLTSVVVLLSHGVVSEVNSISGGCILLLVVLMC